MQLYVGQTSLQGDIERYASSFELLELRAEADRMPKASTLRRWRRSVPEDFAFSVVLPKAVAELAPGARFEEGILAALKAVELLQPRFLLLQTPASVTPASRMRTRLEQLAARLRDSARLAWEPRGPWEAADARRFASELGAVVVDDAARSEPAPGDVVYTRLRALGRFGGVSTSSLERAALRLVDRAQVFVIIEGPDAVRGAALLRELMGVARADEQPNPGTHGGR